jgi:UDP-glucose 4-epimerase
MRILLTGASGLLGRHATLRLRSAGHHVTTVSRVNSLDSSTVLADLSEPTQVHAIPGDFDSVVHLAALLPSPTTRVTEEAWFSNNTQSTLNLLEFCRRRAIKRFVFGSTWSVYGNPRSDTALSEEAGAQPDDPYSLSKLSAELLIPPYCFCYGVDAVILRFSYLFGVGMRRDTVVEKFLSLAASGSDLPLLNGGVDRTDLLYVKDAAAAVQLAMTRGAGIFNIGSGTATTIEMLAIAAKEVTRSTSRLTYGPRGAESRRMFLSIEKARRELGWTPRYSLSSGLRDFLEERR